MGNFYKVEKLKHTQKCSPGSTSPVPYNPGPHWVQGISCDMQCIAYQWHMGLEFGERLFFSQEIGKD